MQPVEISFFVEPALLLSALDRCGYVINSNAREYGATVLLNLDGSMLSVSATDTAVTVHNSMPVFSQEGSGSICINHRSLKQWLDNTFVLSQNVEFKFDGKRLSGKAKRGRKANFAYVDAEMYPKIFPLDLDEKIAEVNGDALKSAIDAVATVADTDGYTVLRNVLFSLRGNVFELMAASNPMFGYYRGQQINTEADDEFLIDAKALLTLSGAIKKFDNVSIHKRERSTSDLIFFSAPNCYVYTQTKKDRYPPVKDFLSEDHENKALVNKDEFIRALRASGGFTKEGMGKAVVIKFDIDENIVELGSTETELGSNVDIIEDVRLVGNDVKFNANIDFMLQAANKIEGMKLWLHYEEDANGQPKMIHITDVGGVQKFTIAPMRLP